MGKGDSIIVAFLLTFLFGPLGVFYSSVLGGVMLTGITLLSMLASAGVGVVIFWPLSIAAGMVTASWNKEWDS